MKNRPFIQSMIYENEQSIRALNQEINTIINKSDPRIYELQTKISFFLQDNDLLNRELSLGD